VREHEAEVEQVQRREESVLGSLEATERALQTHRRKAERIRAELEQVDLKAAGTQAALEDLSRRIQAAQKNVAGRLAAFYKAGRLGSLPVVASAESMTDILKQKNALGRILAHDEETRRQLAQYHSELSELDRRLQDQKEQQRARMDEYARQIKAIGREKSTREALLARIRDQKAEQAAVINQLLEASRELDRRLDALRNRKADGVSGAPSALKPFSTLKGLLPHPVRGRIVNLYGPYKLPRANVQAFRSGINIASDRGEPVAAVHAGRVLYASWLKGYGNVVIIDHGEHYCSVYAHLEESFASVDRLVDAGDVVATVGDSGGMGSSGLYFELRHHGKPIDPMEWLK
jgi:septal ring factor EnvC (AmiA/AmiB activator)